MSVDIKDINEGDLVRATKGEEVHQKRVIRGGMTDRLLLAGYYVHAMHAEGWTLDVIEKALPPLPTEPGWFAQRGAIGISDEPIYELTGSGAWYLRPDSGEVKRIGPPERLRGKLVRLVPETDQ